MGMSLSMGQSMRMEQRMEPLQSLGYKQLLKLSQELHSPFQGPATKGLEGIYAAQRILSMREGVGVLIGGLAASVWKEGASLNRHKDVDVLLCTDDFPLHKDFEGGIDWWVPHQEQLRVRYAGGYAEKIKTKWWSNGNGVVLNFGVEQKGDLKPGLYIPNPQWITDMRTVEALSRVSTSTEGTIDEDVIDKFQQKQRDKMGYRLRNDVSTYLGQFHKRIVDIALIAPCYTQLELVRAANTHEKIKKETPLP